MYRRETMNEYFKKIADKLDIDKIAPEKGCFAGLDKTVESMLNHLMRALFPHYFGESFEKDVPVAAEHIVFDEKIRAELALAHRQLVKALNYVNEGEFDSEEEAGKVFDELPNIYDVLKTDVQAAYEGDPAAKNYAEIILSYPAFSAIAIYRIAHVLYNMNIPILPRMMTEHAHRLTGIDIHPGATIGRYFFIDHGTGVVIGETTTIGEHVKLYQHVTLGAKSFAVEEDGTLVKGIKRHPDIGNNVVIYAGATILGGDTVIGDNCTIGGNVWLLHSVPSGETVYYEG